jgi:hypothetical protein
MAAAIMATTIAGAKENSGVIGVEVVSFVEFGLGDILTVGVGEAAVVADDGLVGAWVMVAEGDEEERMLGVWFAVDEFVGDTLGEVVSS